MSSESAASIGLSPEAQLTLSWLRTHYHGGRAPVFSVQEIARALYGRTDGPAPGSTFDPAAWGRLRQAISELQERGLVSQGRLPQGDFGFRLAAPLQ